MKNDWHLITAERLRTLREDRKLSFQKLHDGIKEYCDIDISADSLSNYEVTFTQNHTRANKCKGMKIEFLRAIAQFYNVSTDYLLGLSDIPTSNPNVKAACEYTGLTDDAISAIMSLSDLQKKDLASILAHSHFKEMMLSLCKARDYQDKAMQNDSVEKNIDDAIVSKLADVYLTLEKCNQTALSFSAASNLYFELAKSDFAFIIRDDDI